MWETIVQLRCHVTSAVSAWAFDWFLWHHETARILRLHAPPSVYGMLVEPVHAAIPAIIGMAATLGVCKMPRARG